MRKRVVTSATLRSTRTISALNSRSRISSDIFRQRVRVSVGLGMDRRITAVFFDA